MKNHAPCGTETKLTAGTESDRYDVDALAFVEGLLSETETKFCFREKFVPICELNQAELDEVIQRREKMGRDVELLRRYRRLKFRTTEEE